MKQTPRTRKVNEAVRETIATILAEEVADPRLAFVTITSVEVSADLAVASVYVTAHGGPERYAEVLDGLASAKGRIRSLLGQRLSLRVTPELRFHIDRTVDESMRITEALKRVPPTISHGGQAADDDLASG